MHFLSQPQKFNEKAIIINSINVVLFRYKFVQKYKRKIIRHIIVMWVQK